MDQLTKKFLAVSAVKMEDMTPELLSEVDGIIDELKRNAMAHQAAHDMLMNRYDAFIPVRNNIMAKLKLKQTKLEAVKK